MAFQVKAQPTKSAQGAGGLIETVVDGESPAEILEINKQETDTYFVNSDFSLIHMVMHPTTIPKLLLQSVAGNYWTACRRTMTLMPLSFVDNDMEKNYSDFCRSSFVYRLGYCIIGLLLNICVAWGLVWLAYEKGWFVIQDSYSKYLNHTSTGGVVLLSLLFYIIVKNGYIGMYEEHFLYVYQLIFTGIMAHWGVFSILRTVQSKPYSILQNQYKKHIIIRNSLAFGLPYIEYSRNLEFYYRNKMMVDAICTATFFAQIIIADSYIQTRSKVSIWFHFGLLIIFIAAKFGQWQALLDEQLKASALMDMGFMGLIFMCSWVARWFRELQERANIVRVRESQSRVESLKHRRKKRRFDQSPAEEILELLNQNKSQIAAINKQRKATAGPNSLPDVLETLETAINAISKTDKRQENLEVAMDPTKADDAIKEDAFINMFRLDKQVLADVLGGTVKREVKKETGTKTLSWHGESLTVDEVTFNGPMALSKLERQIGQEMEFRFLDSMVENPAIVIDVGFILFSPFKPFLDVDNNVIVTFLYALHRCHWQNNPFHNSGHAANVAHISRILLQATQLVDCMHDEQGIGFLLAGLGHCIGHSGRNNLFYISSDSILAISQNDNAVLEGLHSLMLQRLLLSCDEVNILKKLGGDEYNHVRKFIVEYILCLDMSKHFEMISKSRLRRTNPDFDCRRDPEDRDMALQMILKLADLGHNVLDWTQHSDWCFRLQEEYYQQGAEESEKNIPVSPMCDRNQHTGFAKTQAGYMQLVLMPLLEDVCAYEPNSVELKECLSRGNSNKQKWESLRDQKKTIPIPSSVQSETAPSKFTIWSLFNLLKSTTFKDIVKDPGIPAILRA